MSVAELQKTIAKLPVDQQRTVAKFVTQLKKKHSAAHRRRLGAVMRAMDVGEKYTRAEVMRARAAWQQARG